MPQAYTFTGPEPTLGYFAYRDAGTQRMLVAERGQSYQIVPAEQGLPVPPPDGKWEDAPAAPAKSVKAAKGAEGGDN